MTTKTPTNIHLSGSAYNNRIVAVCCDYDGARYHIWIDRASYALADSTLFKNPPLGVAHRGEGDFPTRLLDVNGAFGRKLVPILLAAVPALAPAFEERIRAEIAQEEAKRDEAVRLARIKEAGPALLAALEAARLEFIDTHQIAIPEEQGDHPLLMQMDAAISQAKGL